MPLTKAEAQRLEELTRELRIRELEAELGRREKGSKAAPAVSSPKPKKEIKREEPKLSFMERLAAGWDEAGRRLREMEREPASPLRGDAGGLMELSRGMNNLGNVTNAAVNVVADKARASKRLGPEPIPVVEAAKAAYDQFLTPKKPGAVQPRIIDPGPKAPKSAKVASKLFNFGVGVAVDPMNAVYSGPFAKAVPTALRETYQAVKQSERVRRALNPIITNAQRLARSEGAEPVLNFFGAIGRGPVAWVKRAVHGPMRTELDNHYREVEQVLGNIDRKTLEIQLDRTRPVYNQIITDYAAHTDGANPINEMVRQYVLLNIKFPRGRTQRTVRFQEKKPFDKMARRDEPFSGVEPRPPTYQGYPHDESVFGTGIGGAGTPKALPPVGLPGPQGIPQPPVDEGILGLLGRTLDDSIKALPPKQRKAYYGRWKTLKEKVAKAGKNQPPKEHQRSPGVGIESVSQKSPIEPRGDYTPGFGAPPARIPEEGLGYAPPPATAGPGIPSVIPPPGRGGLPVDASNTAGLKDMANAFGVDYNFIKEQGEEIIRQMIRTEGTLQKHQPQMTSHVSPINWLENMFGKEPVERLGEAGANIGAGTAIKEIREAGLRRMLDRVVTEGKYISDAPQGPTWIKIPSEPGFEQVAGKYTHPNLLRLFHHEAGRSGLRVGDDWRSSYLANNDALLWFQKQIVGSTKKGFLFLSALPNAVSNHIQTSMYLRRHGVAPITGQELIDAIKSRWSWRKAGVLSKDAEALSKHSSVLANTLANTTQVRGASHYGQVAKVKNTGKYSFKVPTEGELWAKNPVNQMTELHGLLEESYKEAMFKKLRGTLGDAGAAKMVEKALFDYGDRGDWLEWMDKFGVWIFNTFPNKVVDQVLDVVIHQPNELLRFKHLRDLAVGEDDPMSNPNLPDWMRNSPFTVPLGGGDYTNWSRFHPAGGVADMIANLRQGVDPGAELANIQDKSIGSPLRWIAGGNKPFTMDDRSHPPLLADGQPANEKLGLQMKEAARSYFPAGRAIQAGMEAYKGIGPSDTAAPRTMDDVLTQYLGGQRVVEAEPKLKQFVESTIEQAKRKGPGGKAYGAALQEAWKKPTPESIKRKYRKLNAITDPKGYETEFKKLNLYINKLMGSTRVVNKEGKVVDPDRLLNAAQTFVWFIRSVAGEKNGRNN